MAAFTNTEFEFGGMNHLALTCSDMQRTVDFYTNILGMKLVKTLEFTHDSGCGQHFGSDIHVMLALRRNSCQIVVTDEELDGPDMIGELLGKGQRIAHQPRHALPQRVVEPFDVIGFPRQFADRLVLRRGNHLRIDHILIRVKCGVLTVRLRDLGPQVLGTRVAAITHVKGNDLAGLGIHSDPHPLLVGFFLHEARQFIGFHFKALDQHIAGTGDGLDMQMLRQRLEALDQKPQEPLESDPHRATDTAQGNPFYEQAFDEAPLFLRDEVLLTALDELTPTVVAVMVLFTIMNVTIFLKLGRLTLRAHLSDDHGFR